MKTHILYIGLVSAIVALGALAGASLLAPVAQGQERQAEPEVPADLLKAQVASTRNIYEARWKVYPEIPKGDSVESLYLWSVRWLNAERDMSKNPADRAAAVEAHLERMKKVAEITKKLVEDGVSKDLTSLHVAAAEFYRVEAEIWLVKAKVNAKQA